RIGFGESNILRTSLSALLKAGSCGLMFSCSTSASITTSSSGRESVCVVSTSALSIGSPSPFVGGLEEMVELRVCARDDDEPGTSERDREPFGVPPAAVLIRRIQRERGESEDRKST